MKKTVYTVVVLCMLPVSALANDRTEEGTAASRNVSANVDSSVSTYTVILPDSGVNYVNPAGGDPYENLYRRYSAGSANQDDFLTIKRQGIELNGNRD